MFAAIVVSVIAAALALALLLGLRTHVTRSAGGKILAFVVLLVLPVVAVWGGFSVHMERATSTSFCLSCHVMSDFGRSLHVDDRGYLPAVHYQNNLVPRDHACYTCHTDYTMFGGINAKIRGLRHLYVQYLGTIPKPEDIKVYEPYNNRECLHCHRGSRRFEEVSGHRKTPEQLGEMLSGKRSCLSSGCHDIIHDVGSLGEATFWRESQ